MHKRTRKEIHESVLVFVGVSIGLTELAYVHLGCGDKVLWKRMTCKVRNSTGEDDMAVLTRCCRGSMMTSNDK